MTLHLKAPGQLPIVVQALVFFLCLVPGAPAQTADIDTGALHRLIQPHLPRPLADGEKLPTDSFDTSIILFKDEEPVLFSIPGFKSLGCHACHEGESLHRKATDRMRGVLTRLKKIRPDLKRVPLRQYIIQSWPDALLAPHQLAHTTFDTVRISPAAVLIDREVYGENTHLHEFLHLTQKFVGSANELEAYGLNVRSDPRFLLLNFPYFEDVVKTFFMPDLPKVLNDFFSRPIKEKLNVPREVQWFLAPFDPGALDRLQKAIEKMEPLLSEVERLNHAHPKTTAYLSEQTGNSALTLEIAAARHLTLPAPEVPDEIRHKAFKLFDRQMKKNDNTRLGYKVDRKKEALLFIQHQLKVSDERSRLLLYFHYLKERFFNPRGEIILRVEDDKDFASYVLARIEDIQKMTMFEGLTEIEREAARQNLR